jgi:yecA family protein
MTVDLKARLSKKERNQFEMLMEARDPGLDGPMQGSITRVHGFLTSIACGPMVMPSEWIPVIFHDPADVGWESKQQAQRSMSLLMRFHNEIVSDLSQSGCRYSIMIDRLGDGADSVDLADDWCRGYVLGIGMREDEWQEAMEAPELRAAFLPILTIAYPKSWVSMLPRISRSIKRWLTSFLTKAGLTRLPQTKPTRPPPKTAATVRSGRRCAELGLS